MQASGQAGQSVTKSFSKEGFNQIHLQSILNLKNLLKGTRQTNVGTTYLMRASIEEEVKAGDAVAD